MSSNYPSEDNAKPVQGEKNPYMQQGSVERQPDLDEGAPALTVNEVRQLNRKALFFLTGIVAMIVMMGFWFINSLSNRDKPQAQVAVAPQVVETPDLPDEVPPPPSVPPVDMAPPLPPLPPVDDELIESPTESSPQPSLVDRRIGGGELPVGQGMAPAPVIAEVSTPKTSAKRLRNPDALLVRGTYIRCVLETRITSDLPGNASCIVSEPTYSINGRSLLLPVGTKLLGTYGSAGLGEGQARNRMAVVWDRAITPTGLDVSMASPGVDILGSSGHPGQYDAHWANRITTAVLVSLISDVFKYVGEKNGPRSAIYLPGGGGAIVDQPYQSTIAQTVEGLAQQAVQESALRKPTITINQGSMLNVYVSQDVDFTGVLSGH